MPAAAPPAHACVRCRLLPELPSGVVLPPGTRRIKAGYRPAKPLTAPHGGPRSQRCDEHEREHDKARRAREAAGRSRKRSGLDEAMRQLLLAFQGHVCAGCGRGPGRKRQVLAADHDHELARQHDHAEDKACELCMRGFLCSRDNRDILGLLFANGSTTPQVIAVLRNLADYLEDPPMAQLRRQLAETENVENVEDVA